MTIVRKALTGLVMLVVSAGVTLLPAAPAYAVDDFTALNNCTNGAPASFNSGTFAAGGNNFTRFDPPNEMFNNDAFRITAFGTVAINYWGTRKDVAGDSTPADSNWPLPGQNQYMLIAKVDKGEVITNRGRRFLPNQWFPVGRDSGCFRYVRTTPITQQDPSAFITLSINDPNIGDNGGYANVNVLQWFCAIC
jgi:hypothetical protein